MLNHLSRTLLLCAAVSGLSGAARGQDIAATPTPTPAPVAESEVSSDSPRASVQEFLDATRKGRYQEAAAYLTLNAASRERGPELAKRLKDVLDRHLWIDPSQISPLSEGDLKDGLTASTETIGAIPGPSGRDEPVRLTRVEGGERARWVFSRATVMRIDVWYEALGAHWLREHLPEPLLRPGPKELLWWQWIALIPLIGLALAIGRLAGAITIRVLHRFSARTTSDWDDRLIARLGRPITLVWAIVAAGLLLIPLDLYAPADLFLRQSLRAFGLIVFFWGLWRVVDLVADLAGSSSWLRGHPSSRSMLALGERLGKVVVVAIGLVAALSELGYPVASLVAGLGLGGLAFALAAQKTVENLFGSVSLAVDEPFRLGDFVKIEDFAGTVEVLGLRSTQIRTLDRTLISIPNGRLADMKVESYTVRDRMRLACTVSLVYSTTATQMREVLAGLESVLRAHPKIWPDAVVVRFKELGASSLDIEIMAWFQTPEWSEFQLIRQNILIEFMEVVEKAGSGFAFPTQTLHVESLPPTLAPPQA